MVEQELKRFAGAGGLGSQLRAAPPVQRDVSELQADGEQLHSQYATEEDGKGGIAGENEEAQDNEKPVRRLKGDEGRVV